MNPNLRRGRGGAFSYTARECRVTTRTLFSVDTADNYLGVRPSRAVEP